MQFVHIPTIMGGWAHRIPLIYDGDSDTLYYGDSNGNHTDIVHKIWGGNGGAMFNKNIMHLPLSFYAYNTDNQALDLLTGVMPRGSRGTEISNWCRQNLEFVNYSKVANTVLLSDAAAKHNALHGSGQAFGYVDGKLYFGINHSKITTAMILNGWDYNTLLAAPQIWGWVRPPANERYNVQNGDPAGDMPEAVYGSDDKWLENYNNSHLKDEANQALYQWWHNTHFASFGKRNWF